MKTISWTKMCDVFRAVCHLPKQEQSPRFCDLRNTYFEYKSELEELVSRRQSLIYRRFATPYRI